MSPVPRSGLSQLHGPQAGPGRGRSDPRAQAYHALLPYLQRARDLSRLRKRHLTIFIFFFSEKNMFFYPPPFFSR